MYAVEFQTHIRNGMIEIPPEYLREFKRAVRVILLTEETTKEAVNFIDQLLAHPLQIKQFQPFTREEIYAR